MTQLEAILGDNSTSDNEQKSPWIPAFEGDLQFFLQAVKAALVGTKVEVAQSKGHWRPATISSVNKEDHTYNISYEDDDSSEQAVQEERLRHPSYDSYSLNESSEEVFRTKRLEVISEIIESERTYVAALQNLKTHYIQLLQKPGIQLCTERWSYVSFSSLGWTEG